MYAALPIKEYAADDVVKVTILKVYELVVEVNYQEFQNHKKAQG